MAKKTVWDLELNISGKDKGATAALNDIAKGMKNIQAAGKQLGTDFKGFAQNATKLAAGIAGGVAAATTGVVAMANSFAATGDKVAKTSASIGIGIEAYQELQYAMGQSGLSAEEFDAALGKFNLTVSKGAAGNKAAVKELSAMGLSAKKLAGMKPEKAMMELSEWMKALPSDAARTTAAVTLFGKSAGPKMMAAMKQGSSGIKDLMNEARSLGIVITDEQAHQSEAYGDAMSRLKQSVNGMKNQFIGGAIGPLTEAFDHFKNAIVEQMPVIQELGKNFGKWLGDMVKRLPVIIAKIKEFGVWIKETANRVAGFVGGWKNVGKIIAGIAIAPTLISGLKTVFSLGNLIKTTMTNLPGIMAKLGLAAGPISGALLPIIGMVAGIAAAAFLIVKNWDKVKPAIFKAVSGIKDIVVKAIEALKAFWAKNGESIMAVINNIADILTGVLSVAWTVLSTAIGITAKVIGGFIGVVSECVNWLTKHRTVLGAVGIVVGTLTTAIVAYNIAQAIANAGGIVSVVQMGAQAVAAGVWSVAAGIAATATTVFGAAMAFLTSPITVVILIIGAVVAAIYLLVKNWDWVKDVAGKTWDAITGFVGKAWEGIKNIFGGIGNFFGGVWGSVKNAASNAWEGIKGGAAKVGGFLKNNWKTIAIGMVNPWAGGLKAMYDHNETFRNFVDASWGKIKDITGKVWDAMPDGVKNVLSNIIGKIKGFIDGIKNFFSGLWAAIKQGPTATIEYLKNAFFGLFDSIKQKIESFVNFFKEKMEAVKNFFGGIGDKVGGFVGGAVDKFKSILPGHAEGGIFTHRHIAEIAERGAEAVVPLNNSPQGFDIWKQAGDFGGYIDKMNQQTATASTGGTPPVMQAAAKRISGGDNGVSINFSQNITLSGGTPDKETVNQISAAGKEAADELEARFKSLYNAMMRDQRRVSFA